MNTLTLGTSAIRQLDGLYSLNDLHRASGGDPKHKPANFLRLDSTRALIAELQFSDVRSAQCADMRTATITINGGQNRGTYVCRELVYAYTMWISAAFHLKVIRAFDASQAQPPVVAAKRKPGAINEEGVRELARWAAAGVVKPYMDKIEETEALNRALTELARTQRQLIVAQKSLLAQTRRELRRYAAPPVKPAASTQMSLDLAGGAQ